MKNDSQSQGYEGCEASAWATLTTEASGMGVVDCGATETIGSLPAIQQIIEKKMAAGEDNPVLEVDEQSQMKFRFGNGQTRFAESSITLQNWVGGQSYPMK
eukprot:6686213-Alexandrium_andersonii.AAC.1